MGRWVGGEVGREGGVGCVAWVLLVHTARYGLSVQVSRCRLLSVWICVCVCVSQVTRASGVWSVRTTSVSLVCSRGVCCLLCQGWTALAGWVGG